VPSSALSRREKKMSDNQTHPEILDKIQAEPEIVKSKTGTGMFLVPTFSSGRLASEVHATRSISYEQCVAWGQKCIAFKWVPDDVESYEDILNGCPEAGQRCSSPRNCSMRCICDISFGMPGTCQSVLT
jgi:hypothetical protein